MFVQPYRRRIGALAFGLWVTHPPGLIGIGAQGTLRGGQAHMAALTGRVKMEALAGEALMSSISGEVKLA